MWRFTISDFMFEEGILTGGCINISKQNTSAKKNLTKYPEKPVWNSNHSPYFTAHQQKSFTTTCFSSGWWNPWCFTHLFKQGSLYDTNPKHCTLVREILQIYHVWIKFDPPKMSLMIHVNLCEIIFLHHPPCKIRQQKNTFISSWFSSAWRIIPVSKW